MNVTNVEDMSMTFPCNPKYLSSVRLVVASIANTMGFNIEEIEDIKLAVGEAVTNAIKHSNDDVFNVSIQVYKDKIKIDIDDKGNGFSLDDYEEPDLLNPKDCGLGLFIIKSLMDDVNVVSSVGSGSKVSMSKFLGVDN